MTVDRELVEAAARVAAEHSRGDEHTVAAAARARDGRIVTAMNVHHFTGGPCAELAVMGAAAAQGAHDLDMVVAVGGGERGVMSPCGRCRQVLFDYFPSIRVIVDMGGTLRSVPVTELLPGAYIWSDHQS
ncbi:cytidine deaminase [Actinomadura coerulea]|uniref:Cytidine deaminase n=1 Tax=Actinomadura coerulea TaxID=46159 RepID=A0A7X0G328_9ACTN|nr:cytidine deaminase [Actinomadura coerulea]MBB6398540.1 cytidine deaminase [Actinomadura coerulea]GGQ01108.1 cytidine deaminase [Actinomadura coerulea]